MKKDSLLSEFYNKRKDIYKEILISGSLYDKVYNLLEGNKTVLDVGCANGNFSKEVKKKGNKVYGIEVSNQMALRAKKVIDHVIVGNIEEMKFPWKYNSFDIILLMDILEHLFNPQKTLINLKKYLKNDGYVIVSIPNVANWEVRLDLLFGKFDSSKTRILEDGHIRFFTFESATKMFKKSGYKIVYSDSVVNLPLVLLKIHNRLPFLGIKRICETKFKQLFGFQFIFKIK